MEEVATPVMLIVIAFILFRGTYLLWINTIKIHDELIRANRKLEAIKRSNEELYK